ncbi:MAG: PelA/Pel-15E family pectate lyase [Candidatus Latescibacterota bacterium]|jgi:PelA/Pel-15E family pectate lyase
MPSKSKYIYLLVTIALIIIPTIAQAQQRPSGPSWRGILRHPTEWYGTEEAIRIADNVLLYQHKNGGWGKNVNMAKVFDDTEKAKIIEETKTVQTTIDNGATFTQMRFLARVYQASNAKRFKDSFLLGTDYLLAAQYENGGWPQFYPIRKGYYQHITFNDGAMIGVMSLLRDISQEKEPFTFVDQPRRDRATTAINKGLEIILKTQITANGKQVAWCAQHDRETLLPAKARAYELPSISGSESVGIVRYLMEIENPDAHIIQSIKSAVSWFERSKLLGIVVERKEDPSLKRGYDRIVVQKPDAPPMWGRFYDIESNRVIFVGRDSIIKYNLADIEHERRIGYSYLGNYATRLLEKEYPAWKEKWQVD